jgi:hypothetical protein
LGKGREKGERKLEIRNWKLEIGNWKLEKGIGWGRFLNVGIGEGRIVKVRF